MLDCLSHAQESDAIAVIIRFRDGGALSSFVGGAPEAERARILRSISAVATTVQRSDLDRLTDRGAELGILPGGIEPDETVRAMPGGNT